MIVGRALCGTRRGGDSARATILSLLLLLLFLL
jgi:hypothetical protein